MHLGGKRGQVSAGCPFDCDTTGGTTHLDDFLPSQQEVPTSNRAHQLPWTGSLGARNHYDGGPPHCCRGAQCNSAGHRNGIILLISNLHGTEGHHILSVGGRVEISDYEAHWKGICSRGVRSAWALIIIGHYNSETQ